MSIQRNLIALGISLTLMGGAFAYGVHKGTVWQVEAYQEQKQELQAEIFDLNLDLNEKNAEILRLNREKEGLINDLEQQALEAKGADNPGVAATGGLRRLEQRWGPSPTSTD